MKNSIRDILTVAATVIAVGLGIAVVMLIRDTNSPGRVPGEIDPVPNPAPTPNLILANVRPEYLCNHLADLKRMPHEDRAFSGDPIYDALIAKKMDVVPCLVEKITDTTVFPDPREDPHITDFAVGDAAVFMLLDLTQDEWPKGMLPPKYDELFKTEGVYSYFAFVEEPQNRKYIQRWWRNWLKSCAPDCIKKELLPSGAVE